MSYDSTSYPGLPRYGKSRSPMPSGTAGALAAIRQTETAEASSTVAVRRWRARPVPAREGRLWWMSSMPHGYARARAPRWRRSSGPPGRLIAPRIGRPAVRSGTRGLRLGPAHVVHAGHVAHRAHEG